jgi:hypothetical protein
MTNEEFRFLRMENHHIATDFRAFLRGRSGQSGGEWFALWLEFSVSANQQNQAKNAADQTSEAKTAATE